MSSTYKSIVLASRPKADIIPNETFKTIENPRPKEEDLKDGEVLVESLYLSLDPAMRGWLADVRSYIPPVQIDEVMRGASIAKVLASKSPSYKPGSYAVTRAGWAELAICPDKELTPVSIPSGGRLTDALGPLGGTGMTAYFGLLDVGQPKAGELVVVSGAAGATGSMVVQFALLKGCRVVGIAGAKDKCDWLEEMGCEKALNYKDADFREKFKEATKDLIDIYFDNVGGEILDMALGRAKIYSRFVMCGGISQYNAASPVGPKNISMVIRMRIRMQGFIVFDYASRYPEAQSQIAEWLSAGKLHRKEHVIKGGLEAAPQGLVDLFKGANTGKLLVEIKPDAGAEEGARL